MQTAQTQSTPSRGSKGSCPSEAIDLDMDMGMDVPPLSLRTLSTLVTLGDEWVDEFPSQSQPKQDPNPHPHPTPSTIPTSRRTTAEPKPTPQPHPHLEPQPDQLDQPDQPDQASRKRRPRTSGKKTIKNGGKKGFLQYPAGKMTAHQFISVSWPVHLVIQQAQQTQQVQQVQQGEGRDARTLMEFDLKPREYSTGSYGWTGNAMGNLPTDNGLVPVRAGINMIVRGSKPAKK